MPRINFRAKIENDTKGDARGRSVEEEEEKKKERELKNSTRPFTAITRRRDVLCVSFSIRRDSICGSRRKVWKPRMQFTHSLPAFCLPPDIDYNVIKLMNISFGLEL